MSAQASRWRAYPSYKDSGIEWFGKIPNHWEVWKIAHAFEYIGSGTTPTSGKSEYYDGDIPWVNTSELRDGFVFDTEKKLTQQLIEKTGQIIDRLQEYRTALISAAVTGKIDVRGEDEREPSYN
jgi:restriction endonuclease S subunit